MSVLARLVNVGVGFGVFPVEVSVYKIKHGGWRLLKTDKSGSMQQEASTGSASPAWVFFFILQVSASLSKE